MSALLDLERAEGRAEGKAEGKVEGVIGMVRKKVEQEKTTKVIAEELGLEVDYVSELIELLFENRGLSDEDLARMYVWSREESR